MKKVFTSLLLILSIAQAFCQTADADKLKELNATWIKSFVTRDSVAMAGIYADDMELVNPSGRIFHKQEMLKNLMSPNAQFVSSKVDTVSVRILGNVGLVNATATAVAKTQTGEVTYRTCYLDVYEKRNGRWWAVASQVALLSEK